MEIKIEDKPYSITEFYSGEVSEEGKSWEFSLADFNNETEITWIEDTPPNHKEVENDIKNQFNIWNR